MPIFGIQNLYFDALFNSENKIGLAKVFFSYRGKHEFSSEINNYNLKWLD